jgi:serine protease inhibitor ecotin
MSSPLINLPQNQKKKKLMNEVIGEKTMITLNAQLTLLLAQF